MKYESPKIEKVKIETESSILVGSYSPGGGGMPQPGWVEP